MFALLYINLIIPKKLFYFGEYKVKKMTKGSRRKDRNKYENAGYVIYQR
jgi:hypothetical protein